MLFLNKKKKILGKNSDYTTKVGWLNYAILLTPEKSFVNFAHLGQKDPSKNLNPLANSC